MKELLYTDVLSLADIAMNSKCSGDSYDLVKRVLLEVVSNSGLEVYADPMITDSMPEIEKQFHVLINAKQLPAGIISKKFHCLFVDPDIGLSEKKTKLHVTFYELQNKLSIVWDLIFVYDQSFSRSIKSNERIQIKLMKLRLIGLNAFYYASHANFLFVSKDKNILEMVEQKLLGFGIPNKIIVKYVNPENVKRFL
jgi:hypothetical protein